MAAKYDLFWDGLFEEPFHQNTRMGNNKNERGLVDKGLEDAEPLWKSIKAVERKQEPALIGCHLKWSNLLRQFLAPQLYERNKFEMEGIRRCLPRNASMRSGLNDAGIREKVAFRPTGKRGWAEVEVCSP